ncbi:hypothetical protein EST38_g5272 [Candolleomyces aberdarensis]|uniref:Uncharacterized protein n=1 Tax=Candolleomyces aberdarensis TaxID=2316362 RepID=A0A4V1Q422_9AGAR|nr:hypothetical protein EST38_g5272 [Candolleomyces aberdarensis]
MYVTATTPAVTSYSHRMSLESSRRGHQPPAALSLGLRTSKPPDTFPAPADPYNLDFTEKDPEPRKNGDKECEEVSDQEWELHTGRAIYVLQETLPTFFQSGLITCIDATTGAPKAPNSTSSHHSSSFHIPIIDSAASLDFLSSSASADGATSNGKGKTKQHMHDNENPNSVEDEEAPIYSPNVRLQYEPPMVLPAPFPTAFKLEGLQMYLASSSLLRHTMNTLYSDLEVTVTKISVYNKPPPDNNIPPSEGGLGGGTAATTSSASVFAAASSSPSSPSPLSSSSDGSDSDSALGLGRFEAASSDKATNLKRNPLSSSKDTGKAKEKKRLNREKYLLVRQLVTGVNRVSGKPGEWEVESLYTFSPLSGLILKHTINSIRPAPHIAVYDSLKMSLGKMFGFGHHPVGEGTGAAAPTAASAASVVHPDHVRKGL